MNNLAKSLLLLSGTLCTLTASASTMARVYLPFSFVVNHQMMPAGNYMVDMDGSRHFITLANSADVRSKITSTAGPSDAAKASAVLIFDLCGETHVLRTIHVGDWSTIGANGLSGASRQVCTGYAPGGSALQAPHAP